LPTSPLSKANNSSFFPQHYNTTCSFEDYELQNTSNTASTMRPTVTTTNASLATPDRSSQTRANNGSAFDDNSGLPKNSILSIIGIFVAVIAVVAVVGWALHWKLKQRERRRLIVEHQVDGVTSDI
jgi:hypothetical protein